MLNTIIELNKKQINEICGGACNRTEIEEVYKDMEAAKQILTPTTLGLVWKSIEGAIILCFVTYARGLIARGRKAKPE